MRIEPEISAVDIVLVGNFNPAIFTPAWFALHGLLPEGAAENADLRIAHPRATEFSTEWLRFDAATDRFQATTHSEPSVRVRDFVARVLRERLVDTPIKALGINRVVHFRAPSPRDRDRVGRLLAPVEPWQACSEKLGLNGEYGGMRSLTMANTRPEGRPPGGAVNITVEPSVMIDDERLGIFVGINDHYVSDNDEAKGNTQLLAFLENGFDSSIQHSDTIIDHIMSLATNEEGRVS